MTGTLCIFICTPLIFTKHTSRSYWFLWVRAHLNTGMNKYFIQLTIHRTIVSFQLPGLWPAVCPYRLRIWEFIHSWPFSFKFWFLAVTKSARHLDLELEFFSSTERQKKSDVEGQKTSHFYCHSVDKFLCHLSYIWHNHYLPFMVLEVIPSESHNLNIWKRHGYSSSTSTMLSTSLRSTFIMVIKNPFELSYALCSFALSCMGSSFSVSFGSLWGFFWIC